MLLNCFELINYMFRFVFMIIEFLDKWIRKYNIKISGVRVIVLSKFSLFEYLFIKLCLCLWNIIYMMIFLENDF